MLQFPKLGEEACLLQHRATPGSARVGGDVEGTGVNREQGLSLRFLSGKEWVGQGEWVAALSCLTCDSGVISTQDGDLTWWLNG